jgi:hypothetical protein
LTTLRERKKPAEPAAAGCTFCLWCVTDVFSAWLQIHFRANCLNSIDELR